MKVISPARPVFLAVFLTLTTFAPAGAQQTTVSGERTMEKKQPVAASLKPAVQSPKPASPAAAPGAKSSPAPASSPKPETRNPKSASPKPSPTTVVTTPKGDTINVTVAAPAPPPEPKSNNWAAGVIGLALLTGLGFFGLRYARQRGLTVPDALQKMGVEMPQDGVAQGARPLRPVAPQQTPLPSLADLPAPTPPPPPPRKGEGESEGVALSDSPSPFRGGGGGGVGARLVGLEGAVAGVTLDLTEPFSIGRDAENALALTQDATVSRRHASVEPENGGWRVRDNGSSNGTYINGVRLAGAQTLQSGDEIQIGSSRLRFEG